MVTRNTVLGEYIYGFTVNMFGVPRLRAETRHRLKEELKRVIQTAHRVRHWEKRWISLPDTNLQVYKWVPIVTATDNAVSSSPVGTATSARRTPTQPAGRNVRPGSSTGMHSASGTPRASLGADESSSQQANANVSMNESTNAQPSSENNSAANSTEDHESFRQR